MSRGSLAVAIAMVVTNAVVTEAQVATQVVTFQVTSVSQLSVSGNPAPLVISTANAGAAPSSVTSAGTSYAITTNEANQKITASLDQALPVGITLEVSLTPPAGASASGPVLLGTASADLVTGISTLSQSGLPISYRLSATPAVHLPTPASRTVTFTIVSGT